MAAGVGVLVLAFSEVTASPDNSARVGDLQGAAIVEADPSLQGRVVAIPMRDDVPTLGVGDSLELYVFDDTLGSVAAPSNEPVSARVVEVRRDSLVVTVAQSQVGRVAAGIVSGQIVVAAA